MKWQSYVILAIIFVIIVAVFAVANVSPVEVNYLLGIGKAPLILVILFSVLMGGIITASAGVVKIIRQQREHKALQAECNRLRSILKEHGVDESEQITESEEDDSIEKQSGSET
ncbi:LapA family protein [Lentibacillus cibarius]|uniref:DUF1049 domain-containing protein n=1 Tax=Lentibacillus cibarius TaxID=2583219 RepID=A0A5S3QKS3_9BACI|nr:lipopolysaccharide assembly protein LapA domain-containing protein [Lentibacillus cibarius]TMN21056.1 DUF1049 domain-containing protein [Lentibacillus cibarius]